MDWSRLQEVLIVCLPVFAMIGLGKVLETHGILTEDRRNFANWITYNFALPALIFSGVARQRFFELFELPLLLAPLGGIIVVTVAFVVLARLLKLRGSLAAAFIFGTFWANVSYMGFPLAANAFGAAGTSAAAIYNAFVMPFFVILAFALIAIYREDSHTSIADKMRRAVVNPIVMSAVAGIAVALLAEPLRGSRGGLQMPEVALSVLQMTGSFLDLVGSMGLPLALLAVGGSMHFAEIRKRLGLLALVLTGKLVVLPFLVLLVIRLFFADAEPVAAAVAVMLSATPNAVASFVVAREIGVEEGFVSSMLVLSTGLSVITLPVWLYIML